MARKATSKPAAPQQDAIEIGLQRFTDYDFTPSEAKLLEVLLDPDFRKASVTDICKEAKISRPTYYAATSRPDFIVAMKAESSKLVSSAVPGTVKALLRAATSGQPWAVKMVLEMDGMYSEKVDVTEHGPGGGPIPIRLQSQLAGMTDDQLEALADQALREQTGNRE